MGAEEDTADLKTSFFSDFLKMEDISTNFYIKRSQRLLLLIFCENNYCFDIHILIPAFNQQIN
jgi:hypothetical protein